MLAGILPSGGKSSHRARSARSICGPCRCSGADVDDAGDAGDVGDVGDVDVDAGVDASGGDGSGVDASDDDGSGVDGSGVDGSGVDGPGAAAGGSCSSWNGCSPWNRSAISLKARFISGDTVLARASFIFGDVAPGIACCKYSLKLVGLSRFLGMCLNH